MKTAELTGAALDWAVAKCWGVVAIVNGAPWLVTGGLRYVQQHPFNPSTNWAQGGPIIERERIDVFNQDNGYQGAIKMATDEDPHPTPYFGTTLLIAAMRCYVANKLGDEVEIPQELT